MDTVVLASDSQEILDVGYALFGEKVQYVVRPPEISHDKSKSEETLLYVINKYEDMYKPYIVVLLEPTNPLNKADYIEKCLTKVHDGYDSAGCFVEDYGFFLDDVSLVERPMRQDIKPRLRETGNCWATKVDTLIRTNNRLGGKIGTVVIPQCDSLHLDSELDWKCIEAQIERVHFTHRDTECNTGVSEDYWNISVDPDGNLRDKELERESHVEQHSNIITYVNSLPGGRLLDIGCGLGFMLSSFDNKFSKYGVEPNLYAAGKATKYGAISRGLLLSSHYIDNFFDVVVMSHVIEHMGDPKAQLEEVRRILVPGGKLIIETPDFDCETARRFGKNFRMLDDETHVSLFTTLGLHGLLKDTMFEVDKVEHPFYEQRYFTEENLMRLFDTTKVSPPAVDTFVTIYCHKK